MAGYTRKTFDLDGLAGLVLPRRELGLTAVAFAFISLRAGRGYTFTHRHREQEEVYLVLRGRGRMLLDDEVIEIAPGDVIRVAPETKRALAAAEDESLLAICAGAAPTGRYRENEGADVLIDDGLPDFDDVPPWWSHDLDEAKRRNEKLRAAREGRG